MKSRGVILLVSLIYLVILLIKTALLTFFFYDDINHSVPLVQVLMSIVVILSWLLTHQIQSRFEKSYNLVITLFIALLVTNTLNGVLDFIDGSISPSFIVLLVFLWVFMLMKGDEL